MAAVSDRGNSIRSETDTVTVEATDENSIGECAAAIATREPLRGRLPGKDQHKGGLLLLKLLRQRQNELQPAVQVGQNVLSCVEFRQANPAASYPAP
jgi:hypothetical protein